MKGTLLFLILLMVSVTHPVYSQANCFISEFEVVGTSLGSPLEGPYEPCEEITFYIGLFNTSQDQYLHGIGLDLGSCWEYSYWDPMTDQPSQAELISEIPNYSFQGQWQWYESGEILYQGFQSPFYLPFQPVGTGWFYTYPGQNPNINFGDQNFGQYREFGFVLTTSCDLDCNTNPPNSTCDISFKLFSDSETGSYNTPGCFLDEPVVTAYTTSCNDCENPEELYPTEHSICSGENFILDLPNANSNSFYNWTVSDNPNVIGASDGFSLTDGLTINQNLVNTSFVTQTLIYTIVTSNTLPGCELNPVEVEVTIYPREYAFIERLNQGPCTEGSCVTLFAGLFNEMTVYYEWSNGVEGASPSFNVNVDCSFIDQPSGLYQVTLTNSVGCTAVGEIFIENVPIPFEFSVGPRTEISCNETSIPITVSTTNPTVNEYFWLTPDGEFLTGETIEAETPGLYRVEGYDINGCNETYLFEVTQSDELLGVEAGAKVVVNCSNNLATLDATNTLQGPHIIFSWSTLDGEIVSGEETLTPTVMPGNYTLTMTDTVAMCSGADQISVFPSAAFIEIDQSTGNCNSPTIILRSLTSFNQPNSTYSWNTTDGNIVSPTDVDQIEIDEPGTYVLMVIDAVGCIETASITVENIELSPVANAGVDQTIGCDSPLVVLDGSASSSGANLTYEWFANGIIISTGVSVSVDILGIYDLVVTNTINGCSATDQVEVFEDTQVPVASLTENLYNLTCFNGATTQLDATGSSVGNNIIYEWSGPSGAVIENGATLMPSVDIDGVYILTVTNTENACTATAETLVQDLHNINITTTNIDCENDLGRANLNITEVRDPIYVWSNGAITSSVNDLIAGDYSVTVAGSEGVCEEVIEFSIIEDLSCKVIIGGYVYEDVVDPNCEQDNSEVGLANIVVRLKETDYETTTNSDGYYEFVVNTGDYTIQVEPEAPYLLQCSNGMISVSLPDTSDVSLNNNYYLQVLTDFDLVISAQSSQPNPGELQNYTLSYCNYGLQGIGGSVSFTHDPALVWPNPSPTGVTNYDPETRTASWDFSPIPFLLCGSIQFKLLVPAEVPGGTSILSEASVFPMLGDLHPENNEIAWTKVTNANLISNSTINSLELGEMAETNQFKLYPNEPNPFLSETLIRFNLPMDDEVILKVFDMNGRLLMIKKSMFTKGINEISINSGEIAAQGVLFYKVETSSDSAIGKMFKL